MGLPNAMKRELSVGLVIMGRAFLAGPRGTLRMRLPLSDRYFQTTWHPNSAYRPVRAQTSSQLSVHLEVGSGCLDLSADFRSFLRCKGI